MTYIDTGKDKVKKICELLRKETLDPAQEEAKQIVHAAQEEAKEIVEQAQSQAEKILEEARSQIQAEHKLMTSSLALAVKQSIATLKEQIINDLFNPKLAEMISSQMSKTDVIAKLVDSVVDAIKHSGLDTDLSACLPKKINVEELLAMLAKQTLTYISNNNIVLKDIHGGCIVKVEKQNLAIDISDEALKEVVASFIAKQLHKYIFAN